MTDRAVVSHILELFPMLETDAAPCLLLVEKRLNQQRRRQNFVARRVQQIGARHMRGANRLALATTQAVLDGVTDRADVALLHDERFMSHQTKARRPCISQVSAGQQLARVEMAVGVNFLLVFLERTDLVRSQKLELGESDAMLAGDHAIKIAGNLHDAHDSLVGLAQHFIVIRVDGYIGVNVAIPRMHV